MTADHTLLERAELAELLTVAAQSISGVLSTEYPTPTARSYLRPVLGVLSAGPRVVGELTDRLEALYTEPLPATSAGLFTLASYASALGWLTESLVELTTAVDLIPGQIDSITEAVIAGAEAPGLAGTDELFEQFDVSFTYEEPDGLVEAADATGLTVEAYVAAAGLAHAAARTFHVACAEITSGLHEDARYVQAEAMDHAATGEGPGSLPTLVRALLTRMDMEGVR